MSPVAQCASDALFRGKMRLRPFDECRSVAIVGLNFIVCYATNKKNQHVRLATVYVHRHGLVPTLLYLDMDFGFPFMALNFPLMLSPSDLRLFNVDVDGRIRTV